MSVRKTKLRAAKRRMQRISLGLTVRVSAEGGSASFAESDAYQWLVANSVDYGFVFRYPENKTRQTGMDFDPQALRYGGTEHAARMRQMEMCLERSMWIIFSSR